MGTVITAIQSLTLLAMLLAATPASAQRPLSLADAIARARAHNPDAGAAAAAARAAADRAVQARAANLPRIDLTESWQRGNNPVFVFGSRLAQRRFTAADFVVDGLNHPAAIANFRTALAVEQPLFDRVTAANLHTASIARDMAVTDQRLVEHELTAAVTDAFGRVLLAAATLRSATAAVETARVDRELAGNRRGAGRATDADVLQLDVYVALTLERQVQATSDEHIARARLNQLMHEPLDAMFALDPTPPPIDIDVSSPASLEDEAVRNRPEVALALQQEQLAAASVDGARAAFLPQLAAQAGWELNGGTWNSRSSSWLVGAVARINVFHGFADKARLAEARAQAARRRFEQSRAETMARLDVRIAIAALEAARASEVVGQTAAESARESRRIIRDRYETGLADAAMLLRAADAVQQADAQQIAARVRVLTATATLQRAIGRP